MPLDIYTPMQLAEVMFDPRQTVSTSAWRQLFYPRTILSQQEEIMFDEIGAQRPIAPFMLPNAPGKPIYRRDGEQIRSFRPAYTKPKDAVRPSDVIEKGPGEISGRLPLQSPEARFNAEVVRILRYHRNAIERLWDYMAARALIDGQLTVNYVGDSGASVRSVVIDYGRDPTHTVTLGPGARWDEAGVKPFDDLQAWIDTVAAAKFGGPVQYVLMGAQAAAAFMANADVKDRLDRTYRGADDVTLTRGITISDPLNPFTFLGRIGPGVEVHRVSGVANQFQNADGTFTDIVGSKEVVLVSRSVEGVMAFGAILDVNNLQPAEIYSKMWDEQDPSARFIMSQSAPLAIPVNPNCTLKATVLA